ncbi:hypothetical protein JCM13664_04380 [Methylothermus subterraneus]
MLTCRQAVELLSKALDVPLSVRERLALRLHLWLCALCRRYARQLNLLERLCALLRPEDLLAEGKLSPQARERILEKLRGER